MSSDLFPVQLSLTNQATYHLSRKDFSALLVCAPTVQPILEKMLPAASEVFNNLSRLDIVGRACSPFRLFASLVMAVDKVKTDVVHGDHNAIINGMEDKWFKTGIYCDQLESSTSKKCSVLPKFMYQGNEKFEIYKKMSKGKKISNFDGKIEFKENSPYIIYLESVAKDVNNQMLHNIFVGMSGKTVRYQKSGSGNKDEL